VFTIYRIQRSRWTGLRRQPPGLRALPLWRVLHNTGNFPGLVPALINTQRSGPACHRQLHGGRSTERPCMDAVPRPWRRGDGHRRTRPTPEPHRSTWAPSPDLRCCAWTAVQDPPCSRIRLPSRANSIAARRVLATAALQRSSRFDVAGPMRGRSPPAPPPCRPAPCPAPA